MNKAYCIITACIIAIISSIFTSADTFVNWPINVPKNLSATLGEIRRFYLHQGIDIKTKGRPGYPVFAAASGHISRIISMETGYGNAVFLDHGKDIRSVYGHLDSFEEGKHHIDTLAKTLKTLYNSDSLNFNFYNTKFYFKKDEKIALAGESGSGFPHLHFEIRENEKFLNPLDYIHIRDTKSPVIESLYACIEKDNATIYERNIKVKKKKGIYIIDDPIEIEGERIFFKISCYDSIGANNKVGIYRIKVYENKEMIFEMSFDSLTKSDIQCGSFVYDNSKSTIKGNVSYIYFLCRRENNNFSGIKASGNGYIDLDSGRKNIRILVSDFAGNEVTLKFKITGKNFDSPQAETFAKIDNKEKYVFVNKKKNIQISIPKNALNTISLIRIEDSVNPGITGKICRAYKIDEKDLFGICSIYPHDAVYKKPIRISVKRPSGMSGENISQVLIYQLFEGRKPVLLETDYSSFRDVFYAKSYTNGYFALIRDRKSPEISLPPSHEFCEDIDIYRKIRLYASDNLSRINKKSIECIIDGEIFPARFDPDREWIEVLLPRYVISRGMHHIHAKVCDNANNAAAFRSLLVFE